jgi:hypothetical protein
MMKQFTAEKLAVSLDKTNILKFTIDTSPQYAEYTEDPVVQDSLVYKLITT